MVYLLPIPISPKSLILSWVLGIKWIWGGKIEGRRGKGNTLQEREEVYEPVEKGELTSKGWGENFKKVSERMKKKGGEGRINHKNRRETITRKISGTGEDRREFQTLPGTQLLQGDSQTRKVGPNTLYETKASSKGNFGSSSISWFSDFWGHKHLQQVQAAQTLRQHNQLGFHKLLELCKQITHSQDKQSPAKTQPPLGPQEKWAWLCFC